MLDDQNNVSQDYGDSGFLDLGDAGQAELSFANGDLQAGGPLGSIDEPVGSSDQYPSEPSEPTDSTFNPIVNGSEYSTGMEQFAMSVPSRPQAQNGVGAQQEPEEPVEKGISIITREATVLGDIITEGHIDVVGKVRGNIAAQGDVAVHGQVRGDIGGEKIGMYNSRVRGNLNATQGVIVDESSIIDGDVNTKNIIFDGKVKGNIAADSVVVLRSHSYTLGDVTAASIAVEPGAVLNGTVRTLVEGDLEAPFEEVI
ncbi:MAG: polymer-forming cytoskeletal protein [Coriobacteriales bacterium]|jgi:cytoskeletal protein CcmA (bactofilin family)|nr:polymer-forming cytoskeletal protein [Coriobacteriales bacterium]